MKFTLKPCGFDGIKNLEVQYELLDEGMNPILFCKSDWINEIYTLSGKSYIHDKSGKEIIFIHQEKINQSIYEIYVQGGHEDTLKRKPVYFRNEFSLEQCGWDIKIRMFPFVKVEILDGSQIVAVIRRRWRLIGGIIPAGNIYKIDINEQYDFNKVLATVYTIIAYYLAFPNNKNNFLHLDDTYRKY